MTVGEMLAEPLLLHTDLSPASRRERVAELLRRGGLAARARAALSARVLRRPAPAPRHRPRAGGRAEADRLRRAGVGARRLHPQPDPQPAQGPAAAAGPRLPLHQPRPGGGEAHRRRAWPSCISGASSRARTRDAIFAEPRHPYTQALLSAVPVAIAGERQHRRILPGDPPSALNPPRRLPPAPPLRPCARHLQTLAPRAGTAPAMRMPRLAICGAT